VGGKVKKYKIKKYLDLKYDLAELSLRLSQKMSKMQHGKNLELLKNYSNKEFQWPPIFIIGPPRSGSTLLYQLLTHRYKFAYLQNQMEPHNYSIALDALKKIDLHEKYASDFQSVHGATKKPNGPHEGGFFWRRFFPRDIHDYVPEHNLSEIEGFEIRNTLKFLEHHFDLPFLSKNMEAGMRLHSLQKLFPEALYIVVKRDPRAIASSLLKVRLDMYGAKEEWWSIRPKQYIDLIKLPYFEQVAYQVVYIYQAIFDDLIDPGRSINVQYEDLCKKPLETMQSLADTLRGYNVKIQDNQLEIPDHFFLRTNFLFSDKELQRVEQIFKETELLAQVPFALD